MSLKRISAVTPERMKMMNLEMDANCQSQTPGEICCLLSHLKAIHTAYHEGHPYAIIAEDDMVILDVPDFQDIVKTAPADWNIIQLMVSGNERAFKNYELYYNHPTPFVRYEYEYWSTVIYLINRSGMEVILRKTLPETFTYPKWSDVNIQLRDFERYCVADYALYTVARTYMFTRPYFSVDLKNDSSIHVDHFESHRNAVNQLLKYYEAYKGVGKNLNRN